jgi:two-component system cell cycle sensor histidine kinase/response regulator CckA
MRIFSATPNSSCPQQENIEPTILLVEDETPVREVTRAVLEHAGYQVLESNGPEEAIRLSNEHRGRIALLLSDVVMPGMNGPELAQRLQKLQPGLITIFMSGYAERDVLESLIHDPLASYIPKPFTIEILLAGVAKALHTAPKVSTFADYPVLPLGDGLATGS